MYIYTDACALVMANITFCYSEILTSVFSGPPTSEWLTNTDKMCGTALDILCFLCVPRV